MERFVQYWPVAKYRQNGEELPLFTYSSFTSLSEALDQFGIWARDFNFHLISAEVTVVTTWDDGTKTRQTRRVF